MNKVVLEVQNLCKNYPNFSLENVNLNLYEGEIVGFIGPNGSGKSTTIKAIMNLIQADQGQVLFYGKRISQDEKCIKMDIGYVGEHLNFYENTSLKNIYKFVKRLYKNWDNDFFIELIEKFQLPLEKKLGECSKGMIVKFSIALALAHHPKLLILDEPTSGLDPVIRNDVLIILKELCEREKTTIFFSSHITEDIEKITDRVVYIYNGKILKIYKTSELLERDESLDTVLMTLIEASKGGCTC